MERRLLEALSKGDNETVESINQRLEERARLSLCPERRPSDPAVRSGPDGIPLAQTFQEAAARLKANAKADPLERNALLAIIEDRDQEANRLLEVMRKRNARGLSVLKGGKATPPRFF